MLTCNIHPIIFLQSNASVLGDHLKSPKSPSHLLHAIQASAMKKLVVRFLHALFLRALGLRSWKPTTDPMGRFRYIYGSMKTP